MTRPSKELVAFSAKMDVLEDLLLNVEVYKKTLFLKYL